VNKLPWLPLAKSGPPPSTIFLTGRAKDIGIEPIGVLAMPLSNLIEFHRGAPVEAWRGWACVAKAPSWRHLRRRANRVVHVDFEQEIEANAFAQAFGGVVLPSRP
jgi:hypothetical protein